MPPVVYAPTLRDDTGRDRLRMHEMPDGRVGLYVYSALDRLEESYGEGASWVLMSVTHLEQAIAESPFDLLLLDRELHPSGAAR